MGFTDQRVIKFTQALLDNPTDQWLVNYEGEGDERKPVSIQHVKTKNVWALGDWDEANKSWVGTRVN